MMTSSNPTADHLTLSYLAEDAGGAGDVHLGAVAEGFSGKSSTYLDDSYLAAFADQVCAFPLATDPPPRLSGTYKGIEIEGANDPVVQIEVVPVSRRGQIAVDVYLAAPIGRIGDAHAKHEVRLRLWTTHQKLSEFGHALKRAIRERRGTAILEADVMA